MSKNEATTFEPFKAGLCRCLPQMNVSRVLIATLASSCQ
jgi:hypothetical protein